MPKEKSLWFAFNIKKVAEVRIPRPLLGTDFTQFDLRQPLYPRFLGSSSIIRTKIDISCQKMIVFCAIIPLAELNGLAFINS